jgi:cleavage and polyadenylation specificity factor subunit 2
MEQFAALPSPKVVLATSQDLESGFSREIFQEYAQNPNNLILFTDKALPGTLARQIQDNAPGTLTLEVKRRIPLEGKELEEYQRKKQQEEEEEQKKKKKLNQMVTDGILCSQACC